jgi:hypothetical protein
MESPQISFAVQDLSALAAIVGQQQAAAFQFTCLKG